MSAFPDRARRIKHAIIAASYPVAMAGLRIPGWFLRQYYRGRAIKGSVLHVSVPIHTAFYMVEMLRRHNVKADYLALVNAPPTWKRFDYGFTRSRWPFVNAYREFMCFWRVLQKYEVVHSHFMLMPSQDSWELPELRKLGRKTVIHFRGCEIRDRELNMRLHPAVNMCQTCDYVPPACQQAVKLKRRAMALRYGDYFLVTTPDMRDFVPIAEHLPFLVPVEGTPFEEGPPPPRLTSFQVTGRFKIVHYTNQRGIEGSEEIEAVIRRLVQQGLPIDYVFLADRPQEEIRRELMNADLTIGKMKMGYYANSQIEAMMMSVPTVTHIRESFITDEMRASGLILSSMPELEKTLERVLTHPEELAEKRRIARASVLKLHDNDRTTRRLVEIYRQLTGGHF